MNSNALSILNAITRITCNPPHTRKFFACAKHPIPLRICKLCTKYIKLIKYSYKCETCSQTFCLHHFIRHILIFKNAVEFSYRGCNEYAIGSIQKFMTYYNLKECQRYSINLSSNYLMCFIELNPEDYAKLPSYLIALTKSGNIKKLSESIISPAAKQLWNPV